MPLFNDAIEDLYRYPVVGEAARITKNPAYKSGNSSMVRKVPPAPRDGGDAAPGYTCTCQ